MFFRGTSLILVQFLMLNLIGSIPADLVPHVCALSEGIVLVEHDTVFIISEYNLTDASNSSTGKVRASEIRVSIS